MAGTFTGTFSDFDASVTDGVLQGSAKVASVQVKDPNLEGHLQSPDFFDAERHPELTFRSNSIDRDGDDAEDRWGDHHQGPHRARPDHRCHLGADRRPVRRHSLRPEARGDDRPRQVRRQLEQPAAERRAGPRQRGTILTPTCSSRGRCKTMRVLGISGSLRRDSYNTALLRHAGELFEAEGAEFEIYDGLRDIPPFDEDDDVEDAPEAVARIRAAVAGADAVFFTTPEYNSSIPGALKNALDWVSRPLATNAMRNKPVAVDRREHRHVRRRLGTGRTPQGARRDGRPRRRGRSGRRPCRWIDSTTFGRLNDPNLEEQVRDVVKALVFEAVPVALETLAA